MFDLNDQIGLTWIGDNGERYRTVNLKPGTRTVRVKFSTFKGGYDMSAMHYYGEVEIDRPTIIDLDRPNCGSLGGYLGKNQPVIRSFRERMMRKLTKVERDMDDNVIGKIGEETERFNDELSVFIAAAKHVKANFGPGWMVHFEMCDGGCPDRDYTVEELEPTEAFFKTLSQSQDA